MTTDHELRAYAERLRVSPTPVLWRVSDQILELMSRTDALDDIETALADADVYPLNQDGVSTDPGVVEAATRLAQHFNAVRSVMAFSRGYDYNTIENAPEIDLLHPDAPAKLRAMVKRHVELERFREGVIAAVVKFGAMAPPPPDADAEARSTADMLALQLLRILLP